MGFSAIIMSREEAMALPVEKRPLCFRLPERIYTGVFEAIGYASICWKPRPSTEVFDSAEAEKTAVDLCFLIAEEIEKLRNASPPPASPARDKPEH